MKPNDWHIYLADMPNGDKGTHWVSFESDPRLSTTKANIYGRCLPCIENLYHQLKAGKSVIDLGTAYHCWKITTVLEGLDPCLDLLMEFEERYPYGHVYGKLGSGRSEATTKVVVFHADHDAERDRLETALRQCLGAVQPDARIEISLGCEVLYEPILGDWHEWRPTTPIRFPENVSAHLERIKRILLTSKM